MLNRQARIMVNVQQIKKALQEIDLEKLAPRLRVVDIDCDYFEDSSGDESVEIIVVLDDRTTKQDIAQSSVSKIKRAIIEKLYGHAIMLSPYFVFESQSEHEASRGQGQG